MLFLLPFTPKPTLNVFIISSLSMILWISGAFFMFKGLVVGATSRVIPAIGTLIPIFLLFYYRLVAQTISYNQTWAIGILTIGLILITLPFYWNNYKKIVHLHHHLQDPSLFELLLKETPFFSPT